MRSSTINRSTLSRETMDVIENLAGENQNYSDDINNIDEYVRQDSISDGVDNKSKEIDLLWQSFMPSRFNTSSPIICAIGGFLLGIISTTAIFFLLGNVTFSNINANKNAVESAPIESAISQDSEIEEQNSTQLVDENSAVSEDNAVQDTEKSSVTNMKRYVIKDGDTVEAIIKHFYGSYSPEKAKAIMEANNLKNLDRISIDQVLLIPIEE